MDELFNILSCGARFNKNNSKKNKEAKLLAAVAGIDNDHTRRGKNGPIHGGQVVGVPDNDHGANNRDDNTPEEKSKKKKSSHSVERQQKIHQEEMSAFRRRLNIHLGKQCRNNEEHLIDPVASFGELAKPTWWKDTTNDTFTPLMRVLLQNIESGKWLEPTPIQMQCIPALLNGRKDVLGAAPTGSGKSGAFILPALLIAAVPTTIFYGTTTDIKMPEESHGQIRTLLLAPSRELASQLYREVCRIGFGYKKGGLRAVLLSKQNTALFISGKLGGKHGVDVLVSTPLRLVTSLMDDNSTKQGQVASAPLSAIRLVVLDEADRLLDASDGGTTAATITTIIDGDDEEEEDEGEQHTKLSHRKQSGSAHVRTFVEQVDDILAACPTTAIRALFSATMGANVRSLAESILRNPMDVTVRPSSTTEGGANPDIDQKLFFVGKEEGKLLAIRQLIRKGIRPPVLIFLQSKERAQALFGELMYDGVNVDVLHSDKTRAARDAAINKFRQGETWFLITTDLCARGMDFKHLNVVINYDLPTSGVSYVHRIGRCGRAGRKGEAITFFTESDFDHLRTIANIMKLSGCEIPSWMLSLKKVNPQTRKQLEKSNPKRKRIDTIPSYDRKNTKHTKSKQHSSTSETSLNGKKKEGHYIASSGEAISGE